MRIKSSTRRVPQSDVGKEGTVDKESSNGKKGYVAVDSCGINAGTFENGISSVQADHFHDVRLVADFCIPLIHVLSNLKSNV